MPRHASKRKSIKQRKRRRKTQRQAMPLTFGAQPGGGEASEDVMPGLAPFAPAVERVPVSPVQPTFFQLPGLGDAQKRLADALKSFMEKVGRAVQDTATLEVKTYVSDNIEGVEFQSENGKFAGSVMLRAVTAISLDGDINACVPVEGEAIDQALWTLHLNMVQQAQTNRTELIKMALSAISALIGTVKPV